MISVIFKFRKLIHTLSNQKKAEKTKLYKHNISKYKMEQLTISQGEKIDFEKFFEEKQKEIGNFAKEMAELEFELMELNLFISSSGIEHLDIASNSVKKLRQLQAEGKINLEQYEEIAEKF